MPRMRGYEPWLYDDDTGDLVGYRDADGGDFYFRKLYCDAISAPPQTFIANTSTIVAFETIRVRDGIIIDDGNITVAREGFYRIIVTFMWLNEHSGDATVSMWLNNNGELVEATRYTATLAKHAGATLVYVPITVQWTLQIKEKDAIQVMVRCSSADVSLASDGSQTNPLLPFRPSAHIAVAQV